MPMQISISGVTLFTIIISFAIFLLGSTNASLRQLKHVSDARFVYLDARVDKLVLKAATRGERGEYIKLEDLPELSGASGKELLELIGEPVADAEGLVKWVASLI
jgi:hypothetical protein